MERGKSLIFLGTALLILPTLILGGVACAQQKQEAKLIVVGTQISLDMAKDFLTTLYKESVPVTIVTSQFEKVKKEKYIIVLGGVNEPGGVGGFVKQVLTNQEQDASSQPGAEKMYIKSDVFTKGQFIIVFTGPDSEASADAQKHNRNKWLPYVAKWFDIDLSPQVLYGY